jgi:hypothetical protein
MTETTALIAELREVLTDCCDDYWDTPNGIECACGGYSLARKVEAELTRVAELETALRTFRALAGSRACQHEISSEPQKCRHGLFFGTSCGNCLAECAGCRAMMGRR